VRNSAHTLAKLLDPAPGHSVRVVSVTHPEYLERLHAHLVAQGGVALLLRGTEGEAFANPRRRPRLEAFANGKAWDAFPAEEGGAPPLETLPDQPEVEANAALIRAMLAGSLPTPQPILDQVAALAELARTPR
jgi:anthranilate phosphoribosyltransferase